MYRSFDMFSLSAAEVFMICFFADLIFSVIMVFSNPFQRRLEKACLLC